MTSKYSNKKTPEQYRALWYNDEGLRRCCTCNEYKELDAFYNDKKGAHGKSYSCKPCVKIAHDKLYRTKPESYKRKKEYDTNNYFLKTYGITSKDRDLMVSAQGGKCAICNNKTKYMHVDHCHTTGTIREILCANCNKGIGHFQEDIEIMKSAIDYLVKHKQDESAEQGRVS